MLPRVSFDSVQALVQGFLLPKKLHPAHDGLSPIHRDRLTRKEAEAYKIPGVRDVNDILVLICGHGGRDARCGVLGPVLQQEFSRILKLRRVDVMDGAVPLYENEQAQATIQGGKEGEKAGCHARIGLISHIGGHKFAGNVILYLPPGLKGLNGEAHPWSGCGIWYGRVTPDMVDGIISETILKGNLIEDIFRGGINKAGDIILI